MTDEKIMEMIQEGKENKIAILFDRYHVLLYNFFLNRNIDTNSSEDLTQNVFERILKYAHTYDAKAPFKAWIYRIARNVISDHFSKGQKIETLETSHIKMTEASALDRIEAKEQFSQLHQAIALLNKEDQELIRLSKFQKLKYHELAPMLGLSESGVKMRMMRAIKKLKDHYLKLENR